MLTKLIGWASAASLILLLGLLVAFQSGAEGEDAAGTSAPGSINFVGHNLFGDAEGTFHSWRVLRNSIDLAVPGESFAGAAVVVEVDLATIDTGNKRRDDHLRTPDFFDVEQFPVARVQVHSPTVAGKTEAGLPRFTAKFDLDLHGVQKTIEGEIRQVSEKPLAFEGSLMLDRMDFGIGEAPSRWNPMSITLEVPVSFRVEL